MQKKVAVCLSGCGNVDGSEIHESVLSLLFLSREDVQIDIYAPDQDQVEVFDYLNGQVVQESRSVLLESARIARGQIQPLSALKVSEIDALLFPGGLGAIKNLSDYALTKESNFNVNEEVQRVIKEAYTQTKPIGFICIAPLLGARVLGRIANQLNLTIGYDEHFSLLIEELGASHQVCDFSDCVVDEKNKIVSTPAYMTAQTIAQVSLGIEKLVQSLLKMI